MSVNIAELPFSPFLHFFYTTPFENSSLAEMNPQADNERKESQDSTARHNSAVGGGGGGARYRLMSPAKLPISRCNDITIPPGMSPTSFLESPVFISNIKV